MLNISIVQIIVIGVIAAASVLVGKWLGRKSNPKLKESVNVSPRKVKFFISAKDRDTTIFMLLCFATVWLLAWWFEEHIDVATVSLVLGSLITVIITMGTALYPEGNSDKTMEIAMAQKHRRAQIIDALTELFEQLKDPSEFPLQVKTVQKRYVHWTTLDQQGAIPALLLNYGDNRRKRKGGPTAEHASLGETEEYLPFALTAVLKESSETPKPITDQISDTIYTVERLINGSPDLDIDGVVDTEVEGDRSSEGAISALEGTPFEVIKFRIIVTHIYRSNTSV